MPSAFRSHRGKTPPQLRRRSLKRGRWEDGADGGLDMEGLRGRDRGMGLEEGHRGEPAGGRRMAAFA